jgi:hypothetical protein
MTTKPPEAVFDALAEYLSNAVEIVSRSISQANEMPLRVQYHTEHDGPNSTSRTTEMVPDWALLVVKNEKAIENTKAWRAAARELEAHPQIGPHMNQLVGTTMSKMRMTPEGLLRSLLIKWLEMHKKPVFNRGLFESFYPTFKRSFASQTISQHMLGPLHGFWTDADDIRLDDNLLIRTLTVEEDERLTPDPFLPNPYSGLQTPLPPKFTIALQIQVQKVIGDQAAPGVPQEDQQGPTDRINKVLDALHLFQPGSVGIPTIIVHSADWGPYGGTEFRSVNTGGTSPGPQYKLLGPKVADFLEFWNWFKDQRSVDNERVRMALRRFHFAYERARPEDKVLDYMIALEALLSDDERQELSFRLSLRLATLIGANADEREGVFNRTRIAYKVRSGVAHGKPIAESMRQHVTPAGQGGFLATLESDVRAALVEYIKLLASNKGKLLGVLDKRILEGRFPNS